MTDLLHLKGNAVMLGARKAGFLSRDDADHEKIWYISPRRRDKHFFKIYKGWGVAIEILEFLEKHDVYGIKLVVDGKELLMSSIAWYSWSLGRIMDLSCRPSLFRM